MHRRTGLALGCLVVCCCVLIGAAATTVLNAADPLASDAAAAADREIAAAGGRGDAWPLRRHATATSAIRAAAGSTASAGKALLRREPFDDALGAADTAHAFPTDCAATETYCQNGGYINATAGDCQSWVTCDLAPPYAHWVDTHPCTCPPQYAGVDCSIVLPPAAGAEEAGHATAGDAVCGPNQVWDGAFLDPNSTAKHVECFLDNTDAQRAWSLREHRVNVTIDASQGPGNAALLFVLSSRHRNASTPPIDPTYMLCGPVVHDITCDLRQCAYTTDAAGGVSYTCDAVKSYGCDVALGCSPVLNVVLKALAPPVTLNFSADAAATPGRASAQFVSSLLTLALGCQTGTCVADAGPAAGSDA